MAKVYIEGILAEDVFKWFYDSVGNSGGDGAAVIVCKNYKEAADLFVKWFRAERTANNQHLPESGFWHPKDESHNSINFHDNNENFIFTNLEIDLGHGDYSFIITQDCHFGVSNLSKRLEAI